MNSLVSASSFSVVSVFFTFLVKSRRHTGKVKNKCENLALPK